jgi:hypothetical protein
LVPPRLRDHEPQVRVDHPILGFQVAALDSLREFDLLFGGQERMKARLSEEQLERVERDRIGLRLRPHFTVPVGTPAPRALAVVASRSNPGASLSCVVISMLTADAALLVNRIQLNSIIRIFDDDRIIRRNSAPVKRSADAVTIPETPAPSRL